VEQNFKKKTLQMQIIISTEYLTVKAHVQVRKMNDFVESVEFSKFKKKKYIKKI
jgi:hypothetical protein